MKISQSDWMPPKTGRGGLSIFEDAWELIDEGKVACVEVEEGGDSRLLQGRISSVGQGRYGRGKVGTRRFPDKVYVWRKDLLDAET